MKDLATDIISGKRTLLEFPRMAPMPAAHWRHVSSNGSSAQSVLIEQNSDDEKVTQKPAPTSVFVQVPCCLLKGRGLVSQYPSAGRQAELQMLVLGWI